MKLTRRDALATLMIAAIIVPYVGYVINGSMPFIKDPRGMSAVGLILGIVALAILGKTAFASQAMRIMGRTLAVASFGLGIAALWFETNEALLGGFMLSIVVVWLLEMFDHAGAFESPSVGHAAR